MSDYKKTLNLPSTKFPMKANLVQMEPKMLEFWQKIDAQQAMLDTPAPKGSYVLHDGPPYANGHIHMGHALNKILKDIIVKSRNMQGYKAVYVPGWDCHGLPIEHKVEEELKGKKKELPAHVVRKICREYAGKWIDVQRKEFKRLGVFGDWDNPYLSMRPAFESATSMELAKFVEKGSVIRAKKPIYWCGHCHTALAEAEVEYKDVSSPSIYVRFPLNDPGLAGVFEKADPARAYVVIWTTTPWTIPDNMGVCLNADFFYSLIEHDGCQYVLARDLVAKCAAEWGWESWTVLGECEGRALEGLKARHPLFDRESLVVLGDHVTLDAGTGCVHTAPGHGPEDYEVGLKYGLEVYSPLDDAACFLPSMPHFAGMNVFEANPHVLEKLAEAGNLLGHAKINHSYPHCWRCKNPLIFRATTQWFISMAANDLRQKALDAISNDVSWIPSWGRERIYNMIATRPDWCISRQRQWGVPILALLCEDCGEAWNDPAWMKDISARFAKHPTGCDYWFEAGLEEIVPEGLKCPHCGGSHWKKETDILDVWFDSGTTWAAVLKERPDLSFPADLYLEGSDQHRGWFHSSLLASLGTEGVPPYRNVLTHGYVVDGKGFKMSKSVGNVIAPQEIIAKYGADLVRLWASSVEYRDDVRLSDDIIARLVDAYRRIRNTCRYILGCVDKLTPADLAGLDEMLPLDRAAVSTAAQIYASVQAAYESYDFHKVYHILHEYCVTDLSILCIDVLKDRIYCSAKDSLAYRSAVTALYRILELLVRDLAPVLSFTAEEIYSCFPAALKGDEKTVFALPPADCAGWILPEAVRADWKSLQDIRGAVTRAIEPLRRDGKVGHSLDTSVVLYVSDELAACLDRVGADMREYCLVSGLSVEALDRAPAEAVRDEQVPGLAVGVARAEGEKCPRCWMYTTEIGQDAAHPDLCLRCAHVISHLEEKAGE
ncbi:MAG: isoleucine--tRNA ligase [Desulfovibrionaceae bacterium]|nr:isoleucine--tRNA ligase [Desulfovibrionaceae bacterium]